LKPLQLSMTMAVSFQPFKNRIIIVKNAKSEVGRGRRLQRKIL
jgi:hypothetical protein